MQQVIKEFLSPAARKWIYVGFALLGVGFGATQTAYITAETDAPLWLSVAFQVYLYVGGAFGLVAASNTVEPTATISGVEYSESEYEVGERFEEEPPEIVEIVEIPDEPKGRYAE